MDKINIDREDFVREVVDIMKVFSLKHRIDKYKVDMVLPDYAFDVAAKEIRLYLESEGLHFNQGSRQNS